MNLTQDEIQNFMQRAAELSLKGAKGGHGGPFGAIIVKEREILGEGYNQVITSHDPTAHAEIIAIRQACRNINSFDLTGTVIFTSCEPCPMCLSAIYWANIDKIYFANTKEDAAKIGFRDDFIYQELEKTISDRTKPYEKVLCNTAKQGFEYWTEKTDRIEY